MKIRLYIRRGGKVSAVYDDAVLKLGLGPAKVKRASEVVFNPLRQQWEALVSHGGKYRVIAHAKTRAKCMAIEHQVVERKLAKSHGF